MSTQTNPSKPGPDAATLLAVDDEPVLLGALTAALQPHYKVLAARSGKDMLRIATNEPHPDLILLDVMMPEMDGYAALAKLRQSPATHDIPVIFVTAEDSKESEQRGLELGAVDYITKPISVPILLARVQVQLELKRARDHLANQNARLEGMVAERTRDLKVALDLAREKHAALRKSYFGTLMAISSLVELRGESIGAHSRRVADLSRQIAHDMGMTAEEVQDVFVAALLHDIGRIGFPDDLMRKPVNTMSWDESGLYHRHPGLAADVLEKIEGLGEIAAIVRHHHERYDGAGFPDGLSGLDIPLGARIIAAASDFDDCRYAMQATVPMTMKECQRYLIDGRGHRYDPAVIDRLEALLQFDPGDNTAAEIKVTAAHLQEGMQLTRDVKHPDGFLLLSKNTVLSRRQINEMVETERNKGWRLDIYVLREQVEH